MRTSIRLPFSLLDSRPSILNSGLFHFLNSQFSILYCVLVVAIALPMRLANIASYTGKGDEGIRAEQLLLMARGFRPVRDIFASQGPLSLDVFYPFFVGLGETLAGARLAVVVYSALELVAVYWVAQLAGGRLGGWLATALLLASPTYLKNSRLALVEIPAMLPATIALGLALAYQRDGRRAWLVGSAVALALALAIKPMMVAVVPAIGVALVLCQRRGARRAPRAHAVRPYDLVLYAFIAGGLLMAVVAAVGPVELYDQVVRYRLGSRQAEGWSLADNWSMLWGELQWDQAAFFGLAILGAAVVSLVCPRMGLPLAVWAVGTFGLLLAYSPLGIKHAALQPPPSAVLAGAGLAWAWRLGSGGNSSLAGRLAALASALVLAAYVWALPVVFARDRQAMSVGDAGSDPPYPEESVLIQALTSPPDYILVDDPYLAFLNRRLVPPRLVDTSIFRIRSGSLSGADVVSQAEQFDVRLMLLLSDNLRELKKFRDWADDNFVVVKINERSNRKDRALYLRNDADLDTARTALRALVPNARTIDAEFAGQLRVRSVALDQTELRSAGSTNLTLEWEAVEPSAVDWHAITFLRDGDGRLVDQSERALGGGSGGTSTWAPGHWVFRTSILTIPPRTPGGEYRLSLGLYDSRARKLATVTGGTASGSEEVPLATIRVR